MLTLSAWERLPSDVNKDWWKLIIENRLDEGSSAERFEVMMKFLDKEKERVECQTSSLNRSSGSGGGKAVTNCVVGLIITPNQVTDQGQEVYKLLWRSVVDNGRDNGDRK